MRDSLPKRERAELHGRFADWLESVAGDRVAEFGEIIGHHLEQAYNYQAELGAEPSIALGERASSWLVTAARRAMERFDWAAAEVLFAHAAELVPPSDKRLRLKEHAIWCLRYSGNIVKAVEGATALARDAGQRGSEAIALRAGLMAADSQTMLDAAAIPGLGELVTTTLPRLEQLGDAQGVALAHYVQAFLHDAALRYDQAHARYRIAFAESMATDLRPFAIGLNAMFLVAQLGTTPIAEQRADAAKIRLQMGGAWSASDWAATAAGNEVLVRDTLTQSRPSMRHEPRSGRSAILWDWSSTRCSGACSP